MSVAPVGPLVESNALAATQATSGKMKRNNIAATSLEALLCSGGDERLIVDVSTGTNMYGCSPEPSRSSASISFASSTATSISPGAFAHLSETMAALNENQDDDVVEKRLETLRQELLNYFGMQSTNADIVFVPSGTDATLQSVFLSRLLSPEPTTKFVSLVLAADEAASRVAAAASGRHFNSSNPLGETVSKGSSIAGLGGSDSTSTIRYIELSHAECQNEVHLEKLVDSLVDHNEGAHVLLHAIDSSKLGTRTPSLGCLERIQQRNGKDSLTILIDACQFRLSARRMREHIARQRLVTITGSKFLASPPFSGAIVVPGIFRSHIQRASINTYMSSELAAYTTASDWPRSWINIRSCLAVLSSSPLTSNIGQFLRWTAAIYELRRYLAVPLKKREQFIVEAGFVIQAALSSVPDLLEPLEDMKRNHLFDEHDEEFRHPTIFPFLIRRRGKENGFFDHDACKRLYNELSVPTNAFPVRCLIGQPVTLTLSYHREPVAVLRLAIDARIVADEFERRHSTEEMTTDMLRTQVEIVIHKIATLINHQ